MRRTDADAGQAPVGMVNQRSAGGELHEQSAVADDVGGIGNFRVGVPQKNFCGRHLPDARKLISEVADTLRNDCQQEAEFSTLPCDAI
jgi:hypothetical protein